MIITLRSIRVPEPKDPRDTDPPAILFLFDPPPPSQPGVREPIMVQVPDGSKVEGNELVWMTEGGREVRSMAGTIYALAKTGGRDDFKFVGED